MPCTTIAVKESSYALIGAAALASTTTVRSIVIERPAVRPEHTAGCSVFGGILCELTGLFAASHPPAASWERVR